MLNEMRTEILDIATSYTDDDVPLLDLSSSFRNDDSREDEYATREDLIAVDLKATAQIIFYLLTGKEKRNLGNEDLKELPDVNFAILILSLQKRLAAAMPALSKYRHSTKATPNYPF